MFYLAADHRGFQLKEATKGFLKERDISYEDMSASSYTKDDDYVDFARAAAEKISVNPSEHKGIFLCGSGHGMDMVANKFRGIRAALCWNAAVAKQSREHEDANVLVLPADWLDEKQAREVVEAWLATAFSNKERHMRRLEKVKEVERHALR